MLATESSTKTESALARILTVDDDPAILKLLKLQLSRAHYHVTSCSNAKEALKLLEEVYFDCVITDAMMPQMTGYEFVSKIRTNPKLQGLPVLMLSRVREKGDIQKAVTSGVSDYILKPIDEHLLLDKVEHCLNKNAGKRHVFEISLSEEFLAATIEIPCRVTHMSETGLTLVSTNPIHKDVLFQLRTKLFERVGIHAPVLNIIKCEQIKESSSWEPAQFEMRVSFAGVPEDDLKKIRSWLQRELIRRRK